MVVVFLWMKETTYKKEKRGLKPNESLWTGRKTKEKSQHSTEEKMPKTKEGKDLKKKRLTDQDRTEENLDDRGGRK